MRPRLLFDTELGARLAGLERVNLGAVVEELLGYKLEKKHPKKTGHNVLCQSLG